MNPIEPHGPPVQYAEQQSSPGIEPGAAFDHFLPDQPPGDAPAGSDDDPPLDPAIIATGPILPIGGKNVSGGGDGGASAGPAMITTGPVRPPSMRFETVSDGNDSSPLPTMITTGPMRPSLGTSTPASDDATAEPGMTTTGPMRSWPAKDAKRATTDPVASDATTMAAQLPALVDLRAVVPAVTMSPGFTSPTPAAQDQPDASNGSGSGADSSVIAAQSGPPVGAAGTGAPTGAANAATMPVGPAAVLLPGVVLAPATAQTFVAVAPGEVVAPSTPGPISVAPAPAQDATPPVALDAAAPVTVTDSRLAAPAPAAEAVVKISGLPVKEGAKIAQSRRPGIDPARANEDSSVQAAENEQVASKNELGGTPVAKNGDVVITAAPAHENELATGAPSKRGGSVSVVTPAPGRAGDGHAPGGEVLLSAAVTGASTVGASTAQVTTATTAADPTASHQAVRVETLLQNALSVGESVRPDGQGQMEMRVRLGGGAEDVTVRMQVANDRMQVTFQTNSPELRKALEQGWQQFSSTASQTSTLALEHPRFETGRFDAATGGQGDNPSFSSNQQNARQQPDARGPGAGGSTTSTVPRPVAATATATTTAPVPGRRWNSWA